MCLSSGGGGGSQKAPVAGGYSEVTINDGAGDAKYKLYDNTDKEITKNYTLDKKKQVVKKSNDGLSDSDSVSNYLYTRDA